MTEIHRIPESFRGWELVEATFVGKRAVFLYQQRGTDVWFLLEETPSDTYMTAFSEDGYTTVLDSELRMLANKLNVEAGVTAPDIEVVNGGVEAAYVYSGLQ